MVAKNDSIKIIEDSLISTPTALKDKLGSFLNLLKGENVEYVIENELLKLNISAKGGRINKLN